MAREIYLAENGQQIGPLTDEELRAMIEQGKVREGTFAWVEGAPDWRPINELLPEFFAMTIAVSSAAFQQYKAAAQQPAPEPEPEPAPEPVAAPTPAEPVAAVAPAPAAALAADQPPATTFEVVVVDDHRMAKLTLDNDSVVVAAGTLHYTLGSITSEPQPGTSGLLTRRTVCRGAGSVCLTPTFGECTVLELAGDEWLLAPGALLACDRTVRLETVDNKLWLGVAGDGFALTKVSGHGKVLLHSAGPLERVELGGEALAVEGDFAIAHSGGLELKLAKSADGLLRTFSGTGAVLLAPVSNRFAALLRAVKR